MLGPRHPEVDSSLDRKTIIATSASALEPRADVWACWEAGAVSLNRVDRWSDIDLYVVCDDRSVEAVIGTFEQALATRADVDLKFRLPEPTGHGHSQVFYRLKGASPFLLIDVVFMKRSSPDKFLQYAIHGTPEVLFDKAGIVKDEPVDPKSFAALLARRIETLKVTVKLFRVLVEKELNRRNDIEALSYYFAYTFRPLVEILRIKYCPYHYNFHTSYIHYDLPAPVVERLRPFVYVNDPFLLSVRREEAEVWFWEVADSFDLAQISRRLE